MLASNAYTDCSLNRSYMLHSARMEVRAVYRLYTPDVTFARYILTTFREKSLFPGFI